MHVDSRCSAIVALLTMHSSWDTGQRPLLSFSDTASGNDCLSEDNYLFIRKYFLREKAIFLLKLWDISNSKDCSHTVWDFMDLLSTSAISVFDLTKAGELPFQWTLDRKRERLVMNSIKQVHIDYVG